jgi:hypothetical protein
MAPEPVQVLPRVRGSYLPRLLRGAFEKLAPRRIQAPLPVDDSVVENAQWETERRQRFEALHNRVSVSMAGFEVNPFDATGR